MKRLISIFKLRSKNFFQDLSDPGFTIFTVNLFIFRILIPFLEYLFIPMACILVLNTGSRYFNRFFRIDFLVRFLRTYLVFIFVSIFFMVALIFSTDLTTLTLRETFTVIFIILILIILSSQITSINEFLTFQGILFNQILIFAITAGILGFVKLIFYYYGVEFLLLEQSGQYPVGTSLKLDHNFYSLGLVFGMILLLRKYLESRSKRRRIVYELLMFVLSISVLLSHSRRGFVVLMIFNLFIIALPWIKRTSGNRLLRKHFLLVYLLLSFAILFFSYLFFIRADAFSRRTLINKISLNEEVIRAEFSSILYDYSTLVNRNVQFEKVYSILWDAEVNPLHPEFGWGYGQYKTVYPLDGSGSDQIPPGSVALVIDKTSAYRKNNDGIVGFTYFGSRVVNEDQVYKSSVFCYVSPEFNGEFVSLRSSGEGYGKTIDQYDLCRKGTWQSLGIVVHGKGESISSNLHYEMDSVDELNSLAGYILLASPKFEVNTVDMSDPNSGWGYLIHNSVKSDHPGNNGTDIGYKLDSSVIGYVKNGKCVAATIIFKPFLRDGDKSYATVYCFVSEDYDGGPVLLGADGNKSAGRTRSEYDLNKRGTWQLLSIEPIGKGMEVPFFIEFSKSKVQSFENLHGYVIFSKPQIILPLVTIVNGELEENLKLTLFPWFVPRNCVGRLLEYLDVFENREIKQRKDTEGNVIFQNIALFSGRFDRWEYALSIYSTEYKTWQKLLGKGFDYIPLFGIRFFHDPDRADYPHNPILSALLYSGILGAFIYVIFLIESLILYLNYFNHLKTLFLFYILTGFFVFFSCNTHFDLPLMTFLSILPFVFKLLRSRKSRVKDE